MAERFLVKETKKIVFKKEAIKCLNEILKTYAKGEKILVVCSNVYLKECLVELENQFKLSNNEYEYLMLENLSNVNSLTIVKETVNKITDDIGMIVAVGGTEIIDLVKAVSYIKNLNFIAVCNNSLSVSYFESKVSLLVDLKPVVFKTGVPLAVIMDKNDVVKMSRKQVASLFSEITSKECFILENYLMNITQKNTIEYKSFKNMSDIVGSTMSVANFLENNLSRNHLISLARNAINMGLEIQRSKTVYNSSESSVCKAFCYLQKDFANMNSYRIISSVFLVDLYEKFIRNLNFYNYACFSSKARAVKLKKIVGVNSDVIVENKNVLSETNRKLFVYSVEEFRQDLLDKIESSKARILQGFKKFKRLDIEGFYDLDSRIKTKNIKDAICVSPDMYNFNNFLCILKDFGVLDYNF